MKSYISHVRSGCQACQLMAVLVCFQVNIMLKKQNMHLKQYGKKIVRMALEETKYEPVLTLYTSRNIIVFSEEPQVAKLLKLKKRMPQFVLMGKYAR